MPTGVRPTGARVREALFSMWSERVIGASFLDLFAGSGSVGLEALSRGARRVLLVECRGKALASLTGNCASLQEDGWRVLPADLPHDLEKLPGSGSWDLVFADPPYAFSAYRALLDGVSALLGDAGHLAVEHSTRQELPLEDVSMKAYDRREYGESALTFFCRPPL